MYNQRQIKMTEKKKLFVLCVALFCFMAVSAQQRMSDRLLTENLDFL